MFFFKKRPKAKVIAYKTKMLKYKNILEQFQQDDKAKHVILLYFFEQTKTEMATLLTAAGLAQSDMTIGNPPSAGFNFLNAREVTDKPLPSADMVYALELHPLHAISQSLLASAKMSRRMELTYFTGLDEAVMAAFNMERIVQVMEKMGIKDDEPIEHSLVTNSIAKAQKKIEKKLKIVKDVRTSQEEWVSTNAIEKL